MTTRILSTEPATGATLWEQPVGDVEAEVATARDSWAEWAARSHSYRIETMRRFATVVHEKREAFADLIARETGKPVWEALTEVDAVQNKVEISIAAYFERTPQKNKEGALGMNNALRHRPYGVLAVLGPFNFPAHLPNGHMVPALIAGNAIVFKPSEKTPAVGEFLVNCYHEAGVPEGVVRLLVGGPDEGRMLASHANIDGLLFTGSARAGLAIHKLFGDRPDKILALELGGNNPLVVWDAPDLDAAATICVQSAFMTAGQRCTGGRRLIVQDGKHEELIAKLKNMISRIIVDHPHAEPAPFMGPVIDNGSADHVMDSFMELMMKGGQPIAPMRRIDNDKPFLTPGLIDVTEVDSRPDEEIFGPVMQVIRVPDFDAALTEANNTRFGLSASLVGGSPELYKTFWANIRAGIVNWNNPTNGASSAAPFGGIGLSGNHRPSAYYAADYCAYPVASAEIQSARAEIKHGLTPPPAEKTYDESKLSQPKS